MIPFGSIRKIFEDLAFAGSALPEDDEPHFTPSVVGGHPEFPIGYRDGCACGHDRMHHMSVWHALTRCRVESCGCYGFVQAAEAS